MRTLPKEMESSIRPAIYAEIISMDNRNSSNSGFVENVALINVRQTMEKIGIKSQILKEMTDMKQIETIEGIHNINNGEVTFN